MQSADLKQLNEKNKELEEQIAELKVRIETLVSKDIMKTLFLSFEDESKEWSIRKDIKNQIYLLLDIKPKKVEKTEDKKWFGIFWIWIYLFLLFIYDQNCINEKEYNFAVKNLLAWSDGAASLSSSGSTFLNVKILIKQSSVYEPNFKQPLKNIVNNPMLNYGKIKK